MNQFGAKPTEQDLKKYKASSNWEEGKFNNFELIDMKMTLGKIFKVFYHQYLKKTLKAPKQNLPILPFQNETIADTSKLQARWYGHAVLLLQMEGLNILIDPMFGKNAAPISPIPVKRFSKNTLSIIDDLPAIDLVLLSHDHYDHLDYDSILRLKAKTKQFYVALGVKRHLVKWGIAADKIVEFDWWDALDFGPLTITFTPSRHFSGRGISDRMKSLWGGWVLTAPSQNIWFSGDGGYGKHFLEIGKRLGPFYLGFMECGQYSEFWKDIHMLPSETIQAAIDGQAKCIMPVHWGAFSLAQHDWKEPAQRFVKEASAKGIPFLLPKLGAAFSVEDKLTEPWWEEY